MLFSQPTLTSPLLTEKEIKQLLSSAINSANKRAKIQSKLTPTSGKIGDLLSSQKGFGSDFAEVRAYHHGDDLRHIDWRATARSRIPLVRTYYSELSSPLCIVIDRRESMRFGTRCRLKVTQAVRLALFIASHGVQTGHELYAVILDNKNHWLPPQRGMQALKLLIDYANAPSPPTQVSNQQEDSTHNWGKILADLYQFCPKASELILISDFSGLFTNSNDSKDKINTRLLAKLGQHCSTKAIRIFDPIEVDLQLPSAINLNWGSNNINSRLFKKQKSNDSKINLSTALEKWQQQISEKMLKSSIIYSEFSVKQDDLSQVIR